MSLFYGESGAISAVGNSYNLAKKVSVNLSHSSSKYFLGRVHCFQIFVNTIVSATTISIKMTSDVTGDVIIVPSTTATLDTGLSTAASGNGTININAVLYSDVEDFYIFAKVDAGTCNISSVHVTCGTT